MGKARWSQQSRGGQDGADKPRPMGVPYNPAPSARPRSPSELRGCKRAVRAQEPRRPRPSAAEPGAARAASAAGRRGAGVGSLGGGWVPSLQRPPSSPPTCAGCSPGMLRRREGHKRLGAVDVLVHFLVDAGYPAGS